MSCRGCKDKMTRLEGNAKMRFVCSPNGKLLKGAPGNFKCGGIYVQPFHLSSFPYWELVEPTPELKIPEASESDSVFDEPIYVPDDDAAPVEMRTSPMEVAGVNVDPNAPAIMEPYMKFNPRTGQLRGIHVEPEMPPKPIKEEPELEEPSVADLGDMSGHATPEFNIPIETSPKTREELKAILDMRGVKYLTKTRTTTLAKMVEDLEKLPQKV